MCHNQHQETNRQCLQRYKRWPNSAAPCRFQVPGGKEVRHGSSPFEENSFGS
ncbi:hypothetical protein IC582_007063 [Cucumis melo]